MATSYYGLTWWQWVIVGLLAIMNAAQATSSGAGFAGGLFGSFVVVYVMARLITMVSRRIRPSSGGEVAE